MAKTTIKTPVEGFNGTVAGVRFEDGVGHTDDENAIAYFERQGYEVAGEVDEQRAFPEGDINEDWTVPQMLAYAKANSIAIGKAKAKADVWAAIQPGGTPYKGDTKPDGTAIVSDTVTDGADKAQDSLPDEIK